MFHHRTNVFSYRANPWQKTTLSSIAEPLDPSHCGSTEFRYLYVWFIYDSLITNMVTLHFFPTSLQTNGYCFTSLNCNLVIKSFPYGTSVDRDLIKHITLFFLYISDIFVSKPFYWCISHRYKNWHHLGHCKHHQPVTKYEAIGALMK